MNIIATTLWLICLIVDTAGQLLFKFVALKAANTEGLAGWKVMLSNFWIWLGISLYVIEFFAWMAFLSLVPLAQGVLVSSMTILTIMLGGRIFYGEKLSPQRRIAITLIAVGVALVGWG